VEREIQTSSGANDVWSSLPSCVFDGFLFLFFDVAFSLAPCGFDFYFYFIVNFLLVSVFILL